MVHAGGDIEGGDESLPLATHFSAPYPETKAEAERMVLGASGDDLATVALLLGVWWRADLGWLYLLSIALAALDNRTLSDYADQVVRPRLQSVEGVGNVFMGGFRERIIGTVQLAFAKPGYRFASSQGR